MVYKRPFDLFIILLIHLFPLTLVVWVLFWAVIPLLIWMSDRGPVFYRQQRVGRDGVIFYIWKFRTMVQDAEQMGEAWTAVDDARITRIGKFLRRTGLDELPQILNVARGEMSLVGPRPLAVEEQKKLENRIPGFGDRLAIPPGITGLAQLYNKEDDDQNKLQYDMYYLSNMGVLLDMKLLFLTLFDVVLRRRDVRTGKERAN